MAKDKVVQLEFPTNKSLFSTQKQSMTPTPVVDSLQGGANLLTSLFDKLTSRLTEHHYLPANRPPTFNGQQNAYNFAKELLEYVDQRGLTEEQGLSLLNYSLIDNAKE